MPTSDVRMLVSEFSDLISNIHSSSLFSSVDLHNEIACQKMFRICKKVQLYP